VVTARFRIPRSDAPRPRRAPGTRRTSTPTRASITLACSSRTAHSITRGVIDSLGSGPGRRAARTPPSRDCDDTSTAAMGPHVLAHGPGVAPWTHVPIALAARFRSVKAAGAGRANGARLVSARRGSCCGWSCRIDCLRGRPRLLCRRGTRNTIEAGASAGQEVPRGLGGAVQGSNDVGRQSAKTPIDQPSHEPRSRLFQLFSHHSSSGAASLRKYGLYWLIAPTVGHPVRKTGW
jgi:hypothetical protein